MGSKPASSLVCWQHRLSHGPLLNPSLQEPRDAMDVVVFPQRGFLGWSSWSFILLPEDCSLGIPH